MDETTFLASLGDRYGLDEATRACLRRLAPLIEGQVDRLTERFYERIREDDEAFAVMEGDEARIARLHASMRRWILSAFEGSYDEAWIEARARIGRIHVQIDLPQHLMLTAMHGLREDLHALVEAHSSEDDGQLREAKVALDRLLDLELAIMLETYREAAEVKLARSERLAAIGELAASIAHDLRGPLSVIHSSLFLLRSKVESVDGADRHLDKIQRQIARCDQIIHDLLDLVGGGAPNVEEIAIEDLLRGVTEDIEVPETIRLEVEAKGAASIRGDPGLLHRALVNLVQNARQAIGAQGGTILISAEVRSEEAILAVTDDGPGFSREVMASAFEPLVTGHKRGVGLGLAIVRGIAERHGGRAHAENLPGGGARVEIRLPGSPGATAPGAA